MKKLILIAATLILTACSTTTAPMTNEKDPTAVIGTTMGEITIELFADKAPETTKNFMELSKQGKYDGVPFHRIVKGFVIQGGDFTNKNGTGGYSYKGPDTILADEFGDGLSNVKGTLSMANRGKNTNGSQFFINLQNNRSLDGKHPVFGKVIAGLDVVEAISKVQTFSERPVEEVLMKSVRVK